EAPEGAGGGEQPSQACRGRTDGRQPDIEGSFQGKVLTSAKRRREAVIHVQQILGCSQREACRALGQSRGAFRKPVKRRDDEHSLTRDIIRLATKYGRYGYKRITSLLKVEGWRVNHKRVERIWRQEALKVPARQKKRRRLYLNDGSCIRLRPCWPNHV